jgi:hypothetical protein
VIDLDTLQGSSMLHMVYRRADFSMVVGGDDKIYAFGGKGGLENEDADQELSSCEVYNGVSWVLMPSFSSPRSGLAVITMNNHFYSFGGFDGHRYLDFIDMYDSQTNRW